MEKKTIEFTSREAMLLSIAVRGFGGSYVSARDKSKTKEEEKKYDNYIMECLVLARKIEAAFGVVSRKIIHDDGSETVFGDGTQE
jgi:hypothetical protein